MSLLLLLLQWFDLGLRLVPQKIGQLETLLVLVLHVIGSVLLLLEELLLQQVGVAYIVVAAAATVVKVKTQTVLLPGRHRLHELKDLLLLLSSRSVDVHGAADWGRIAAAKKRTVREVERRVSTLLIHAHAIVLVTCIKL